MVYGSSISVGNVPTNLGKKILVNSEFVCKKFICTVSAQICGHVLLVNEVHFDYDFKDRPVQIYITRIQHDKNTWR